MPPVQRNQRKTSCISCRTHREFCSRSLPCDACLRHRRNCTYSSGTAPLSSRTSSTMSPKPDAFDMQISRLKNMITRLGASQPPFPSPLSCRYPPSYPLNTDSASSDSAPPSAGSSELSLAFNINPDAVFDSLPLDSSHDLLGPISNLCLGATAQLTTSAQRQLDILTKLRGVLPSDTTSSDGSQTCSDLCAQDGTSPYSFFFSPPSAAPADTSSDNASSPSVLPISLPTNIEQLLRHTPDLPAASRLGQRYLDLLDFLHLLLRPSLWKMLLNEIYIATSPPAADRLAIFFAVIGLGAFLSDPPLDNDSSLHFLRCAIQALVIHRFLSNPTLDTVRALTILNQYALYITNGSAILNDVVSFLPTAQGLAAQLNLHRDPDQVDPSLSMELKEDRRYVQWALLKQEFCTSALIGRTWLLSPPERYDIRFPDNTTLPDTATGIMLNHRLRVASLGQTMVIELFTSPKSTYGKAMSFGKALEEAEESVSFLWPQYDSKGLLIPMSDSNVDLQRAFTLAPTALANIRLYCALLSIPNLPEHLASKHRKIVIEKSRFLLAMHQSDMVARRWSPVAMYMVVGALGLASEISLHPNTTEADIGRSILRSFLTDLTPSSRSSSILRKSREAVRFLINAANDQPNRMSNQSSSASTLTTPELDSIIHLSEVDEQSAPISPQNSNGGQHDLNLNKSNLDSSFSFTLDSLGENPSVYIPDLANSSFNVSSGVNNTALSNTTNNDLSNGHNSNSNSNNNNNNSIPSEDKKDLAELDLDAAMNLPMPTFDWDPWASLGIEDSNSNTASFPWFITPVA